MKKFLNKKMVTLAAVVLAGFSTMGLKLSSVYAYQNTTDLNLESQIEQIKSEFEQNYLNQEKINNLSSNQLEEIDKKITVIDEKINELFKEKFGAKLSFGFDLPVKNFKNIRNISNKAVRFKVKLVEIKIRRSEAMLKMLNEYKK